MIKRYISDFTGIAISLIALGVAAGVVFGDVLFVGAISDSFIATVTSLGDAGAVGALVLAILVAVSN
jgi:hypothetical protein